MRPVETELLAAVDRALEGDVGQMRTALEACREYLSPRPVPLTPTQWRALADVHTHGRQWPLAGPHGSEITPTRKYQRQTLQALVAAGYARWAGKEDAYVTPR